MDNPLLKRPRILFLFSDTGGGHRSAAEAIIEALRLEYGESVETEMVDIFKQYAPHPLDHVPELYPKMVRVPQAWGLGYHLSNNRRANLMVASLYPYVRRPLYRLLSEHPSDLIVSVHPLANWPVLRTLGAQHPPYITVVTDLVTTHALWYDRRTDLCLVPTEPAYQRALRFGLEPERVKIVGLPVAERFCRPPGNREAIRARYGWPQERPLVLLMGGGEGMGPLEEIARTIAASCPHVSLVVIAGRNHSLKERLNQIQWPIPTFIYDFVREMPDFMHAADILVTKAGPGTICEALIAGLPMVLYSRLPGQEEGNVHYTVKEGAGVWAPRPELIASAICNWIEHPEERKRVAAACRRLARPQAARQIARILIDQIERVAEL